MPFGNKTKIEIVWAYLNRHLVAQQDPHPMLAELASQFGEDKLPSIIHLNLESVLGNLNHGATNFNMITGHHASLKVDAGNSSFIFLYLSTVFLSCVLSSLEMLSVIVFCSKSTLKCDVREMSPFL